MKQQLLLFLGLLGITISQSQTVFNDGVLEYTVTDAVNNYVTVQKFNNNCPIGDLIIPETVMDGGISYLITSISKNGFKDCVGIESINIPDTVTSIGESAFVNCSGLTSISIPDGVTSISNFTFNNCNFLTSIDLPNSIVDIGDGAFYGCKSLTSINIPDDVTNIGSAAFGDCRDLTSVNLPDGIVIIAVSTFISCSNLMSVNIPDGVTSIEKDAFLGCYSLTSLDIPSSVTNIGNGAFSGCTDLMSVTVHWNTPLSIDESAFDGVAIGSIPLTVPIGTETDYQMTPVWKDFDWSSLSNPEFVMGVAVRLYPNPVSEFLRIELDNSFKLKQIVIYNNLGQLVSKESKTQINVSNYSRGLYFAEIETMKGTVTRRFLVE